MLQRRHPDNTKRRQMERDSRQTERDIKSKLLLVCLHLANGTKHFQAIRHDAAKNTIVRQGPFGPAAFDSNAADVVELRIELDREAGREFGPSIGVLEFAHKALNFWEEHI